MPAFSGNQIAQWLYQQHVGSIDQMTNLSKKNRERLQQVCTVGCMAHVERLESVDGTVKYLFPTLSGKRIESVFIPDKDRGTLCVSCQVGCKMNCKFCATGKNGFKRNLFAHEIVSEILLAQQDTDLKITNVVFMGQGEPLDNFENLKRAIELINKNLQISIRRLTVSTCGIVPKISELSKCELLPTLAISLHAPNHEIRKQVMPVENKYNMQELKNALLEYNKATKDRITIEYILIGGLNDSIQCAKELIEYLKDIKCNINLIPYNPIGLDDFKKPSKKDILKFKYILEASGKKVTIRLERGADIDAACGQLAGKIS